MHGDTLFTLLSILTLFCRAPLNEAAGCGVVNVTLVDNGEVIRLGEVLPTTKVIDDVLGTWVAGGYDSCGARGVWVCRNRGSVCGMLQDGWEYVVSRGNEYFKVKLVPGPPVSLRTSAKNQRVQSMSILDVISVRTTDTWGNFAPSDSGTVTLGCAYRGVDPGFAVFGTKTKPIIGGWVDFTDITVKGRTGFCDVTFECAQFDSGPASNTFNVEIILGDPVGISVTPVNPKQTEFYPLNATLTIPTQAYFDLRFAAVDNGGNPIPSIPLCADHNLTSVGGVGCVFVVLDFGDPGVNALATFTTKVDVLNGVMSIRVPEHPGELNVTATADTAHIRISSELIITVVERGQFQCIRPKSGATLVEDDLSVDLLDPTTIDEISRTFFDLSVPPPPFVRFNISARTGQFWHLKIPPIYQYWVLMRTPFYIEIDPVLSAYFCFGFNYARVDDLAINLKKPFCSGSDLNQVVAELAILLFDLGDSSAQYHKTRGAYSGTTGTAKFGNFTGFIPKKESLEICVGDRILSPATTGYHIKCCERDTGACRQDASSHSMQTTVIILTAIVSTAGSIAHVAWIVKCLLGAYRACPPLNETTDIAQRAKVVAVHCIVIVFPLFSVIVNRAYVGHLHPLVSLWIVEVTSIGVWFFACTTRFIPGLFRRTKLFYDIGVLQLLFISLWLIWAAWSWTVPAVFLETRRTLVPFTCFSTLLAHCIMKPAVISNFPVIKVPVIDSQDMLLDALISTVLFAAFLTGLVFALNAFEVVTDTQMIFAVVVVLGVGVFMSWSVSGRFAAALRRTVSESAEKAGAIAMDMVNKHRERENSEAREVLDHGVDDKPGSRKSSAFDYRKLAVLISGRDDDDENINPLIPKNNSGPDGETGNDLAPPYSPPVLEKDVKPKKKGILKNSESRMKRKSSATTQGKTTEMLATFASEVINDVLLTPVATPRGTPRDRRNSGESTETIDARPSPKRASLAKLLWTGSLYSPKTHSSRVKIGGGRSVSPGPDLPPAAVPSSGNKGSISTKSQLIEGIANIPRNFSIPKMHEVGTECTSTSRGTSMVFNETVQPPAMRGRSYAVDSTVSNSVETTPLQRASENLDYLKKYRLDEWREDTVEKIRDYEASPLSPQDFLEEAERLFAEPPAAIVEVWSRPAEVQNVSAISSLECIPKVESDECGGFRGSCLEIDTKDLASEQSGSDTPPPPKGAADRIFTNIIDGISENLTKIAPPPPSPSPRSSGGWVEGGNWENGKWVPPTNAELLKQAKSSGSITGQLKLQVRQLIDEAEETMARTREKASTPKSTEARPARYEPPTRLAWSRAARTDSASEK
eukprot:TRINITY_DN8246_c0_g1_i1.p1 TRINITY_DN8246_c0_g1~~TRINITY_DN8246_c0_g1_i1.p1  ORF type:complete len:1343 (+),score=85.04 TRINITY_DN8246_c0_g1_i1:67-4029(+)